MFLIKYLKYFYIQFYNFYYRYIWKKHKGNDFIIQERNELILRLLEKEKIRKKEVKILDVGCGNGNFLRFLYNKGFLEENMYGIDISWEALSIAKNRYPKINFICQDAQNIPFPDNYFDLVFAILILSVVLDEEVQKRIIQEIRRAVKDKGLVFIYDMRFFSPNPSTRKVKRSVIEKYFSKDRITRYILTLNPYIARILSPVSFELCRKLEKAHLFCTHQLFVVKICKDEV